MPNVLQDIYSEFIAKKDIASFIKLFSVITWEKMGFVWGQFGLKFHEVTVTQNLLFQFRILSEAFPNSVVMFEAGDEKANGNDIELFVKMASGYAFFACQAKIASKVGETGVYKSIVHPIKNKKTKLVEEQIDSLLAYAKAKKGIPLYLFYNYNRNSKTKDTIEASTSDNIEVYGCTFKDAREFVGTYYTGTSWKRRKPSFSSLHPKLAKPFYTLFNLLGKSRSALLPIVSSPENLDKAIIDDVFDDLTNYQRPRLDDRDSDYWIPVNESADLQDSQASINTDQSRSTDGSAESGFNPKYRIVIDDAAIDSTVVKWLFL